jgi:NAD(P)-dependent dehydrogenase (short-subunit alcohol dehydrogenase family)
VKVVLIEPGGFRTGIWDDMERDVERHAESRYARAYQRTAQATKLGEPMMGDPARVARVIGRALSSPLPRARYLVGYDAQAFALAQRLTPTTVMDRVTRLVLGL